MNLDLPQAPPWVSVDTETSGLYPDDGHRVACVAITWPEDGDLRTLALPFDQGVRDKLPHAQLDFDFGGSGGKDPNLGRREWDAMLEWLREQLLVFHNAKFDLAMLRAGTRHWPGIDLMPAFHWDTMLAQGVIDPKYPRGLDLTVRRLEIGTGKKGLDAIKTWLKANKYPTHRYDLAPWPVVEPYVTTDTEDTARLKQYQEERMESAPAKDLDWIDIEFDLMKALYRMEQRGIPYDDEESMRAAEELDRRADAIEATMPFRANPTETHNYFIQKLKLHTERSSEKTNKPTIDEEQVRKWIRDEVPFAFEYSQVTKIRRAVSMWYRGYPEKIGVDGRLRGTFRQGEVKSGRMSIERVQLQALPKSDKYNAVGSRDRLEIYQGIPDVRDMIRAEEGRGLWNLDLQQAELRVATKYSACRLMAEQLAAGIDSHGEVTKNVLGVQPDSPEWKTKRDIAKRLNFGGIFQIGGETFQRTLAKLADIYIPLPDAYRYVNNWRAMYPEFGYAYRKAEQLAKTRGYVNQLPGTEWVRRSYFRDHEFPNTAWNRIVQGSLAQAFKMWLAWIEKEHPDYLVLTVHDSVVLEADLDEGDSIAATVAEYGQEMFSNLFDTPMPVDVGRW